MPTVKKKKKFHCLSKVIKLLRLLGFILEKEQLTKQETFPIDSCRFFSCRVILTQAVKNFLVRVNLKPPGIFSVKNAAVCFT